MKGYLGVRKTGYFILLNIVVFFLYMGMQSVISYERVHIFFPDLYYGC